VNASILRLTKEEAWISETFQELNKYKAGPCTSFADRVFVNAVHRSIRDTTAFFDKMQYHEALRAGFFDLLNARDEYRAAVDGQYDLNRDALMHFIEVFLIMLSPICPHFAQYMWEKIRKPGFIVDAPWPSYVAEDVVLSKQKKYLDDVGSQVRAFIVNTLVKSKQKGKETAPFDALYIYVAESYAPWQQTIMKWLATNMTRGEISKKMSETNLMGVGGQKATNKAMGVANNFIAFMLDEVKRRGPEALDLGLPFNELDLLRDNVKQIVKGLDLKEVKVLSALDAASPGSAKHREEATPGKPGFYAFNLESQKQS